MKVMVRVLAALIVVVVTAAAAALFRITRRVEGQLFNVAGVDLHYTVEGEGEPVVLLHGFGVNADINWRLPGITQALAKEFRVIAMDLRGHGLSGKPHDARQYGTKMVDDVLRLLDHVNIDKAHVVGYSLGGMIALKLAVTHPERMLTASPLGAGWERPETSAFLGAVDEIEEALKSGRGVGPLSAHLGGEREKPGVLHTLWVRFVTRYLNDGQALGDMVRALPDLAVEEEDVRRISVPMCSIVGSRDPLKAGVDAMQGLAPDLEITVLEGADHIRAPGRPELLGTLRSFLRKHGPVRD
jgi:pimeloyl-ACP methyl ester carboxylesterase